MENSKLNDKIDFKDINELISGCNTAMVNYALAENKKMVRVVTFFNTDDSDLETIAAAHGFYCKRESKFIISKDIVYRIKSFNHIIGIVAKYFESLQLIDC